MNSEIYYEYFEMVIEELLSCMYCDNKITEDTKDICEACELSIELTKALMLPVEA